MTKKITKVNQLPDFDNMSLADEAEWWETHDLSAIWSEFDDVKVEFEPRASGRKLKGALSSPVNVRLDPVVHKKLKLIAHRKGLGVASLIRMWISENIHGLERSLISKK